jgi:anti-sigma-K factor RskA
MIGKKRNRVLDEQLDRVGREVIRVSAANEAEAEAAAASPFLYTRVRSRINAAREQREAGESWFTMLGVAWRAIPVMALVAIFAVALFLSASFGTQPSVGTGEDVFLATSDAEVENVVFADSRSLSNDDVLANILNGDDQEASR